MAERRVQVCFLLTVSRLLKTARERSSLLVRQRPEASFQGSKLRKSEPLYVLPNKHCCRVPSLTPERFEGYVFTVMPLATGLGDVYTGSNEPMTDL